MSDHTHDHTHDHAHGEGDPHAEGHHGHGPDITQEDDRPDTRQVLIIGVVVFASLVAGAFWSWRILANTQENINAVARMTSQRVRRENRMGIAIDQSLLNSTDPGPRLRARQRQHLESYGWNDRASGVAHIPIERAMARLVDGGLP